MPPDERDRSSSDVATITALATTEPGGTATASQDTIVPRANDRGEVQLPAPGYDVGTVIGRGGMGEVVTARDRRIGRVVAIKRMRGEDASGAEVGRFLREARIQARLDHPTIVPVHELGVGQDGKPYFTMKRLTGTTLGERLGEDVPLQRLLRAFSDVCSAIHFAHERGVVHRDLKPANIMLGNYNEVYVIDWGIARVLAEAQVTGGEIHDVDTLSEDNPTQGMIGTPGYMAPEQIAGAEVTPAVDVYALGAILFEILVREPLHARGLGAIASTLGRPQASPAEHAPGRDIAPELDAACFAALAGEPGARPTARELGERIERYLDGDRDVEARRGLAKDVLANARAILDAGDADERARAVRLAGRALALDPGSTEAAQLVTQLILEPPEQKPPALVAALAVEERAIALTRNRASVAALLLILSMFAALASMMDVRSWTTLGLVVLTVVGSATWLYLGAFRRPLSLVRTLATTLLLAIAFTRVLGGFILTPIIITGTLLAITGNPTVRARPIYMWIWLAAVLAVPAVLELAGVFATTTSTTSSAVVTVSPIFAQGGIDGVALFLANATTLAATAAYVLRLNREIERVRTDLSVQAWHLGQLLPEAVR
jgi:eukaryotic-like serine/threonine-protein kinase